MPQPPKHAFAPPAAAVYSDTFLDDLTYPQRKAVTHVDGPLLVLAAAGSGKTRVITRRVVYMIQHVGLAPWHVLALTFTNKAAGEMRQRVGQYLSDHQTRTATISTFHSFCARIIREHADVLGLPAAYSIYDTADQTRVVKQALQALDISRTNFPPGSILSAISNAKNELLDTDAYEAQANEFKTRTYARVYRKYQQILEKNKALDFDDLLLKTVQLMRGHGDVLAQLRERYQYILIDEYQDTNHAQFVIAHTLAAEHRNLCVTGDPDQSIYSWRGADIRNILEFETHYPDAEVVPLEQNYRSTKRILAVADELIRNNVHRKHKELWTQNDQGVPVTVARCHDEQHEAQWLVEQFIQLHDDDHTPWSNMAVFYRVNSLSRVIEEALLKATIPYQIARGTAFYDRKEIKDAVAYLRVIANHADEVNLLRIINTPARGISDRTIKALQSHAAANQQTLSDLIENPTIVTALNARAVNAIKKLSNLIRAWRKDLDHSGPQSLRSFVERILIESQLEAYYRNDKNDPDAERIANLGELISSTQQFDREYDFEQDDAVPKTLADKLVAYLEQISLASDVDAVDSEQGAITLMTLHAAKGLEFSAVGILGLEDGLLPHSQSQESDRQLEEERRLCFVGITRAQKTLMLSHARYRTIFGQTQSTIPSRFLHELPADHIHVTHPDDEDDWLKTSDDHNSDLYARVFPAGSMVRHPQFGLGKVLNVTPSRTHTRATIHFGTAGTKTLVLEYAPLEVVS